MKKKCFEGLKAMKEFRADLMGREGFVGGVETLSDPRTGEYWVEWQDTWEGKVEPKKLVREIKR